MTKEIAKKHGVCDLEYARELRDLGVKQKSLWYWCKRRDKKKAFLNLGSPTGTYRTATNEWLDGDLYAAFTVAELGERLGMYRPYQLKCEADYGKNKSWKTGHWTGGFKKVKWFMDVGNKRMIELGEITEANARAKMLIHLIKTKQVKP